MDDADYIINNASKNMRLMLKSVYSYNSSFVLDKSQEKLLNRILFGMSLIDRRYFLSKDFTYDDNAFSIGHGQTISQPSTVARMLMLADLYEGEDVLEVGAGSGWNASLLAFLVYPGIVLSIDRINELVETSKDNIKSFLGALKVKNPGEVQKFSKLEFLTESVYSLSPNHKYDKVIVTAGIERGEEYVMEKVARDFLKQKGLLLCPYTFGPLLIFKKQGNEIIRTYTEETEQYSFVPLLE